MEIKNTPTQLILYANNKWSLCNKYAYKTGVGNNTNVDSSREYLFGSY